MKVIVTGATGFVGANIIKAILLKNKEWEIYAIVRDSSNLWRIEDVKSKIIISKCDLTDKESVRKLINQIKPDIIYHTAVYGGLPNEKDSDLIIKTNFNSTMYLIDSALENDVKQFINTGSSSEYGIKHQPMREDMVCEPVSLYGVSKLAATNYCSMIGKNNSFKVCTLRLFSPYGELEGQGRLYPTIVNALKNDEQPKLSKPDSVRDFMNIDKVVSIYLSIIDVDYGYGEIYNVASGKMQTIKEFFYKIAAELGKNNINPVWGQADTRGLEPKTWIGDMEKLMKLLKFDDEVMIK